MNPSKKCRSVYIRVVHRNQHVGLLVTNIPNESDILNISVVHKDHNITDIINKSSRILLFDNCSPNITDAPNKSLGIRYIGIDRNITGILCKILRILHTSVVHLITDKNNKQHKKPLCKYRPYKNHHIYQSIINKNRKKES